MSLLIDKERERWQRHPTMPRRRRRRQILAFNNAKEIEWNCCKRRLIQCTSSTLAFFFEIWSRASSFSSIMDVPLRKKIMDSNHSQRDGPVKMNSNQTRCWWTDMGSYWIQSYHQHFHNFHGWWWSFEDDKCITHGPQTLQW